MTDVPDLLSIGSGGKLSTPQDPGDPAVWTVLGEAGADPAGQKAVASTIINRATKAGAHPQDIVSDSSNGYEAWQAHADELKKKYPVGSDAYNAAAANVGDILTGKAEAPYPYDSFYSPAGQKALGRKPPAFEDGSGVDIGGNRFFSNAYSPAVPDLLSIAGRKDAAQAPAAPDPSDPLSRPSMIKIQGGNIVAADTEFAIPDVQAKTIRTLDQGGLLSHSGTPGTVDFPWVQREATDTFKPGEYFIDTDGALRREPGGPEAPGEASSIGTGLQQGVSDIELSGARLLPGADSFAMKPALEARQLVYNANHAGDHAAQAGRFAGQMAPTLLMGGLTAGAAELGGGALIRAAPAAAPMVDFLAGRAGGNLLIRGGSLAARGAAEGAQQGLFTSGANPNESIADQVLHGAESGAVLNPLIPGVAGVGRGVSRMLEPFTETGRNKLVNRFIADRSQGGPTALDLNAYVPGSSPTLAQATGNAGIATLERGVKAINPTPFASLAASNQQARELALDALKGDRQSLDDLISARSQHTDPMRMAAFANTQPVDPTPVVKAIDAALASPAGQRDVVVNTLTNIRDKLLKPDGTMQTDPAQLWGIRQAMDDMLSPMAAGTKSDGRLASSQLMDVKKALDPVIEQGAPGFKNYLNAYSDASGAIDAQNFLQGLKWTDSNGGITLGRVDSALTRIETMRSKGGVNPAKNIPDATMQSLYALRDDLRRQANSDLGRGSGSDTVQKLATNQLVDTLAVPAAVGLGLHGPVGAGLLGLGKLAYGAKNRALVDNLTERLVDPTLGASAFAPPDAPNRLFNLGRRALVPLAVTGSNNLLLPQQQPAH